MPNAVRKKNAFKWIKGNVSKSIYEIIKSSNFAY